MAKRIKDIVTQVEFYLGKHQSGYHAPDVIVRELNTESLNLFKKLIKEYADTRPIDEFLQPFLKSSNATTVPSTGIIAKPTGFEHADGITLEDGTEVEILQNALFIPRLKHPNKAPSTSYPICRMRGSNIEFAPKELGQKVIIDFISLPTKAVYAVDVDGDTYTYNDGNSIDWEWSQQQTDTIVMNTLSKFGIEVKDGQLIQYSELKSQ